MVVDDDLVAVEALLQNYRALAELDVLADQRVVGVAGDVADVRRLGVGGHLEGVLVVGVKDGAVLGHLDHQALDLGQFLDGVDAAEAEVVGGDVEHGTNVAEAVAEAGAHDAAAGGLDDGHVDHGVAQDHRGGLRAGHVALHRDVAVDVDGVGGGLADDEAGHLQHVGEHPRRGGLAVGAGQRRDRDSRGGAGGEEHVHHRAAYVAAFALRGGDVHAHAGAGVDLADGAAGVAVALGDVGGEEVDAAEVEADGADGALGHQLVVGVDDVGDVDGGAAGGEVGGLAKVDRLALGGDGAVVVAFRGQEAVGGVVELEAGQHVLVARTPAGILVHLGDQFGDGRTAVADHVAGHAPGGGDELAVDHHQPVVIAEDHALDDHAGAFFDGDLEGVGDVGVAGEVDRDAAAVVAVDGLDHHGEADGVRRIDGVLGVADVELLRDGETEVGEEPAAELLVGGDLDGGVRGLAGQCRFDALLVLALADLDQAGVVHAHPGDVAGLGGADESEGGRAEGAAAGEMVEVGDGFGDVERRLVLARGDQLEDDAAGDLSGF